MQGPVSSPHHNRGKDILSKPGKSLSPKSKPLTQINRSGFPSLSILIQSSSASALRRLHSRSVITDPVLHMYICFCLFFERTKYSGFEFSHWRNFWTKYISFISSYVVVIANVYGLLNTRSTWHYTKVASIHAAVYGEYIFYIANKAYMVNTKAQGRVLLVLANKGWKI